MITRVMRKMNIIDRIINKMLDGKTLAALLLYSLLIVACIVCFVMLRNVYGTYIWWSTTVEGKLTAEANPEELYRNCWWSILTIMNNVVFISLFLRVIFSRLQRLDAMEYSIYPTIPYTGFLAGAFSSLYFISAIWSLVSNNLQLLLNRQLVTISGTWQDLFPYHKIKAFNDGQGNFIFSWNDFWSFNIEMIIYFLFFTIVLKFISQFILSYYSYVIESRITLKVEGKKGNNVRNSNEKTLYF
jgi:hypothetical protein